VYFESIGIGMKTPDNLRMGMRARDKFKYHYVHFKSTGIKDENSGQV
jgi:hypothetical protein